MKTELGKVNELNTKKHLGHKMALISSLYILDMYMYMYKTKLIRGNLECEQNQL